MDLIATHGKWIRETFGRAFKGKNDPVHRTRAGLQFNPIAIAFVGTVLLLLSPWIFGFADEGVSDRVVFEDRYLDTPSLRALIRSAFAADVVCFCRRACSIPARAARPNRWALEGFPKVWSVR